MVSRRTLYRPLRPQRNLSAELVERLTEEITEGRLRPGARLPTEAEMIRLFGVSRTVVREAIAAMRAVGLVESRQGAGVFVARDLMARPFLIDPNGLMSIAGVVQVMELRMGVEIEAAGLAARRRTPAQLTKIQRTLRDFDRAVAKGDAAVDADFGFAVANQPAECSIRLIADKQNRRLRPRDITAEMMLDAAARTHARGRHNDARLLLVADLF